MDLREISKEVYNRTGVHERKVSPILGAALAVIREAVSHGEPVNLKGLGKFTLMLKPESRGYAPATGKHTYKPMRYWPKFTASKVFKEETEQNNVVTKEAAEAYKAKRERRRRKKQQE